MAALQTETLVLTTSTTAVEQWKREILDKTDLDPALVGTYTGDSKAIAPVTLATYQIVTYRPKKDGDFPHFHLFDDRDWGLIIYDEVHLLPAPVFRITADIQARRRLGLTATLVREDHREEDVFSLIGPKKYDVPWRVLESKGWIAEAQCHEVRLGLPGSMRMEYAVAEWREKFRLASENPLKDDLVETLLERYDHPEDRVLVIGQYLKQLRRIAERFDLPLITGQTPNPEREELYDNFRRGVIRRLVLSKVGNFAIDLPDANVMVQVSGTFGSRQEEAQRLGPDPPPQGRRTARELLHPRHPRHPRDGLRPPPPALPDRAGIQLRDPRRVRPGRARPSERGARGEGLGARRTGSEHRPGPPVPMPRCRRGHVASLFPSP